MVRWLAFLFWLFSFATWKAFFVRLIWKPPSPDVEDHGVEDPVLARTDDALLSDGEEDDASSEHRSRMSDYLAGLLSEISSETRVTIDFDCSRYGFGPLSCDEDVVVKQILEVIANSAVVQLVIIESIWPFTCEGIADALISRQSVKKLLVDTNCYELVSRVLLENTCIDDVYFGYLYDNETAVLLGNALGHNRTLKNLYLGVCGVDEVGWKALLDPLSGGHDDNDVLESLRLSVYSKADSHCDVHIGNMIRRNTSLLDFGIDVASKDVTGRLELGMCEMDEVGWKALLDPLSGGHDDNNVLESLELWVCSGAESHCDVHIGNMVRRNTSLLDLEIEVLGDITARLVVSSIGEALHFNNHLRRLEVIIPRGPGDVWKGIFASLTPDAQGRQANTTLEELVCYWDSEDSVETECVSLLDMLRSNTSLIEFCCSAWFDNRSGQSIFQLLEALKENKCLEILDLSYCKAVEGRRVLGAIMDLLDVNHTLKEIRLEDTPLERDGSSEAVKVVLEKNLKNRLWEVVQGMATTTPTSGRVFLCGNPYAGKTTLRKTIMENNASAIQKRSVRKRMKALFKPNVVHERVSSAKNTIAE